MSIERKVVRLVKALETVPDLEGKVWPVVVPPDAHRWPALVYALAAGENEDTFDGAVPRQTVTLHVLAEGYGEAMRVLTAAVEAAAKQCILYIHPPPRTDGAYDEELSLFRQSVSVVLK